MSLKNSKKQNKKMLAMAKPLSPSGIQQQDKNGKISEAFGKTNGFVENVSLNGYTEKVITDTYKKGSIYGYSEIVNGEIKSAGTQNLIEPKMATYKSDTFSFTNNGDGTFTLNGTPTTNITFRLDQSQRGGTDNLKSYNGTYTLGYFCNQNVDVQLIIMQNGTWTTPLKADKSNTFKTAKINADNCFIYVHAYSTTTYDNVVIKPILVEGSQAPTTFIPYDEKYHILTDDLDIALNEPLRGLSTKDEIISNVGVRRRYGQITLNGSNDITIALSNYWSGKGYYCYNFSINGKHENDKATILCNKLEAIANVEALNSITIENKTNLCFRSNENLVCIYINNDYNTIEKLKSYLKANPITIVYELATPTMELFNPIYKAKSLTKATDFYKDLTLANVEDENEGYLKSGGYSTDNGYAINLIDTLDTYKEITQWQLSKPLTAFDKVENNKVIRKSNTIVLNGSEYWVLDSDKRYFSYSSNDFKNRVLNSFKVSSPYFETKAFTYIFGSVLSVDLRFLIGNLENGKPIFNSVDEAKAYLKLHPITITYETESEETETTLQNPVIKTGNSNFVATDNFKELDSVVTYWSKIYDEISQPIITRDSNGNIISDIVENAKDSNDVTCKIDRKNHKAIY